MYTYFIISPGYDAKRFVIYPEGHQVNYIKFGDQADFAKVRSAYTTHNPDFGIPMVVSSEISSPFLGTRIKQHIISRGYRTVDATEWFMIQAAQAWSLADGLVKWDNRIIDNTNLGNLVADINSHLP